MLPTNGAVQKRKCAGTSLAARGVFLQTAATRETKAATSKESFTPCELEIDCQTGVPTAACMRQCAHILPYHAAAALAAPAVARVLPFASFASFGNVGGGVGGGGGGGGKECADTANALQGNDALLGWMLENWDPSTTVSALASHDIYGNTPLAVAISAGNERSVRLLLDAKASADATNCAGNNAVHFAAHAGNAHLVGLLVQHVTDATALRVANDAGFTPLDIARTCKVASRRDALVGALTTQIPHVQALYPHGRAPRALVGSARGGDGHPDEIELFGEWFQRFTREETPSVLQASQSASRLHLRGDELRGAISTAFALFDEGEDVAASATWS